MRQQGVLRIGALGAGPSEARTVHPDSRHRDVARISDIIIGGNGTKAPKLPFPSNTQHLGAGRQRLNLRDFLIF